MSSRLTVLNVAYPLAPVGPDAVGGAEQVLTQLDEALVRAGHRSLVIACEGSITEDTLLAIPQAHGELDHTTRGQAWSRCRAAIEGALARWPVDVVHLHGVDFCEYLPPSNVPTLVTLHLPPSWYPQEVFQLERPLTFLCCVSDNQRRACPPCNYLLPAIENGVPCRLFETRHAKRRFALCIGRICPEKGFHLALEAARSAETPLLLAGKTFRYAAHEIYFEREIVPRLDAQRRFIGPVGRRRKRRLLSAARCLLIPSLAPETSSLVAMEALACGTPVIAFATGALPDIIDHGKTGFLVRNVEEMAAAISAADSLAKETCRQTARERFGLETMIHKYFEIYRWLASVGQNQFAHPLPCQGAIRSPSPYGIHDAEDCSRALS
jgi:glycosyltransferase involved in cell wall biosynthesis